MLDLLPYLMGGAVLVTGGAKRIGKKICIRLAKDGFQIGVHYNNSEDEAAELVDQINRSGGEADSFKCDFLQADSVTNLISDVKDRFGGIIGLVNNASLFVHDDIRTLGEESWNSHLQINTKSPLFLIRSLFQEIDESELGSVVNILDQKIASPNPDYLSYTISRFAMLGATETLARGLAPRIRVNAVAPGHTMPSPEQTEHGFSVAQSQTPLGEGPNPEDIANAVGYLMHARAVTGQVIYVDSGERFLGRSRDVLFETE